HLLHLIFFFSDTPPPEIYTLSLHDALPICANPVTMFSAQRSLTSRNPPSSTTRVITSCMSYGLFGSSGTSESSSASSRSAGSVRSEEHTSELQSLAYLVCRLLLEKKNDIYI